MDELRAIFFGEVRPEASEDRALLRRAFDMAWSAHSGQFRKDGSLYITHPIAVATDVWNRYGDTELTAAALLHDVPEDCPSVPMGKIYADFGPTVGFLVDSVTKDRPAYENGPSFADKIEKLLWGGLKDVRCLLLKIADRDHNLFTLDRLGENKQIRMAFETQAIYQPLRNILAISPSGRLGVPFFMRRFEKYIQDNHLTEAKDIKNTLCSTFFQGFSYDTFQAVYGNSESINWKIEDKQVFARLITTKGFEEKVEILGLKEDSSGNFRCIFRYKAGNVFGVIKGMQISSYKK